MFMWCFGPSQKPTKGGLHNGRACQKPLCLEFDIEGAAEELFLELQAAVSGELTQLVSKPSNLGQKHHRKRRKASKKCTMVGRGGRGGGAGAV